MTLGCRLSRPLARPLVCVLVMAAIFILDAFTERNIAVPMLYALVLVLGMSIPGRCVEVALALAASVLTVVGYAVAPLEGDPVTALFNRVIALITLWLLALLLCDQRNLRERMQQARERAEEANRGKTRFLAAASHDLRHPIQSAILFHDLLSRRLDASPQAPLVRNLGLSLSQLQSMLDALLDFSQLDAGAVQPQRRLIPVQELFERLGHQFAPQAEAAGLRLSIVPTPLVIFSDPTMMDRILQNLVSNAINYTRQGGVVIGARRRGESVTIQVWDSGIGIAAHQLKEIFREFHQLNPGARPGAKGLGLGLSLVERLAAMLDHPLSVRSTPGRGSCFAVTVPLAHFMEE